MKSLHSLAEPPTQFIVYCMLRPPKRHTQNQVQNYGITPSKSLFRRHPLLLTCDIM